MSIVTAIKKIHNLVPGGTRVVVRKVNETDSSVGTVEFMGRGDRDVDWWIPWAWEDWHFTGGAHIDVDIAGRPERYSLWQQDDDVLYTSNRSFTGSRIRLGGTAGDRRLVIFPDRLELIGMTDPLPAVPGVAPCQTYSRPYDLVPSPGGDDVSVQIDGRLAIENSGWIARAHSAVAGFGKRVVIRNTGQPIQIQAQWDIISRLRAEGIGYAKAEIILRLEAHPENISGALDAPIVSESVHMWTILPIFSFAVLQGSFPGNPFLSLTISSNFTTDNYVLRAFVITQAGGLGYVQVEASCFGRFLGFTVCRL